MQNRVCTVLVLVSYSVFFTIFLLITNQSHLLLRIMGNNWVTLSRNLTEAKSFCFIRPSKLLSSGGEPFSLTRSRVVSSVCFSFDFFSVGQLEQETRGSEGLL